MVRIGELKLRAEVRLDALGIRNAPDVAVNIGKLQSYAHAECLGERGLVVDLRLPLQYSYRVTQFGL